VTVRIPELRAIAHRPSLVLLAAALLIAGCAAPGGALLSQGTSGSEATPSATPTPTSSAPSGPIATPIPTLAFEAPADLLAPFSLVVVVVDQLNIRLATGVSAELFTSVGKGEVAYVGGYTGPVVVDGVDWYQVASPSRYREDWAQGLPASVAMFSGWAAAGSDGQRFLEPLPPRCPGRDPDVVDLTKLTAWERLACFGDRPLTVEGTYGWLVRGTGGGPTAHDIEPVWLFDTPTVEAVWTKWGTGDPLTLHFRPGHEPPSPQAGSILRMIGHFNDPLSDTCTNTRSDQPVHVDARVAQLYCREQFVVDSFDVVGTDPAYAGFTPSG
jgi:hypothetical protein